jgi:hypothetical protein
VVPLLPKNEMQQDLETITLRQLPLKIVANVTNVEPLSSIYLHQITELPGLAINISFCPEA